MNKFCLYAFLYLLFVIYGSLVPFDYKPIPVDQALNQFKNIKYLNLGIESRADWIANILLYIPLACLSLACLTAGKSGFFLKYIFSPAVVATSCIAVAFSIEYCQLFFPPRTVSINDLIAEVLGTGVGIAFWQIFGQSLLKLYKNIFLADFISFKSAGLFYFLIYLLLSLFPFDFVSSFSELEMKLAGGHDHFLLSAESFNANIVRILVKWLVEILVLLPMGALVGWWPYISHRLFLSLLMGFFLGVFLETAQIFLVSGNADGESVLTRMTGMGLGTRLFNWGSKQDWRSWGGRMRPLVLMLTVPYILLTMAINGWFYSAWLDSSQAAIKLAGTNFLPFFYFYYTTEAVALVSLLSNAGTYIPVGLFFWLWSLPSRQGNRIHWVFVGLSAAILAVVIETGKLYLVDKHADPTDVLIAFFAAAGCYGFINLIQRLLNKQNANDVHLKAANDAHEIDIENIVATETRSEPQWLPSSRADGYSTDNRMWWFSALLLIVIVLALLEYPLGSSLLAVFLVAYGCLLFLFPHVWMVVIPALLPVMDLTPWTGWFFFDEFDLVVLSTLTMSYWRRPKLGPVYSLFPNRAAWTLGLFGVFYFISLLKGLLPLQTVDANAFTNYYSNYNALRVGKGVVWFFLLLPLLLRAVGKHGEKVGYYLAFGVLLGLSGVIGFAMVEKWVFTGLFDFSTDYRVNALFSTMHTGGGHIESYLALSAPFIATLFLRSSSILLCRVLAFGLFATGLYVLLVTFSRGGYIGLGIGFIVLMAGLFVSDKKKLQSLKKYFLLVLLLIGIISALVVPVFHGTLIQQRFGVVAQDREIRKNHWQDAIAMMSDTLGTIGFGMGVGSYPRTHFLFNTEGSSPATYKIDAENKDRFLSLIGGDWLYFGQYININQQTVYRLILDVRSDDDGAGLNVSLCEKSLQYSFKCSAAENIKAGKNWTHIEQSLHSGDIGVPAGGALGGWFNRPVQLSLYNGSGVGKVVSLDNIRLLAPDGKDLIVNGDFSKSTDFWFFSTEKHNPWHIFNVWVQLLFDLGWLGLTAFILLLAISLLNLLKRVSGDQFAAILLSAISGFFVIGFVDSPFDAPRLTLMFFLVWFLSVLDYRDHA